MKKKIEIVTTAFFCAIMLFACATNKEPVVAKSADLNTDFKSIKSYAWVKNVDDIPGE